jgi:hypothetical protein
MTPGRAAVLAVAALLAASDPGADASDAPPARLLEGELLRVDLERRRLLVRPSGDPPREVDVAVDDATVITRSGRTLQLDELKPLQRVTVSCASGNAASCRASRVRARPAREAVGPSPAP